MQVLHQQKKHLKLVLLDLFIAWIDDPELNIDWHLDVEPELSEKDKQAKLLVDAEVFA